MTVKIIGIVAASEDNIIGIKNKDGEDKLPWRSKEDLQFFKKTTLNHVLIMGNKTFKSLPGMLPNRHVVVLSSKNPIGESPDNPFVHFANSLDTAIEMAKELNALFYRAPEIFIAGGAKVYDQYLDVIDEFILSRITSLSGDLNFIKIRSFEKTVALMKSTVEKLNSFPVKKLVLEVPEPNNDIHLSVYRYAND